MSVFSDLVADVYTLTNRPELVDMTKLAVRSATLKAHQTDFYPKDLYETGIEWNPVAYIQSLEYRLVVPRGELVRMGIFANRVLLLTGEWLVFFAQILDVFVDDFFGN